MPPDSIFILLGMLFITALLSGSILFPSYAFAGSLFGHLLGIAGTTLMLLTLIYPFRKRVQGKKGKKNPLAPHIYYGLIGPSLVALHSGHGFSSGLIGTFTFLAMLVVVLSGMTGTLLFKKVNLTLKEQKVDLRTLKELFYRRKEEVNVTDCRLFLGIEPVSQPEFLLDNMVGLDVTARERCNQVVSIAKSISELEYAIEVFSKTKNIFSRWLWLHICLSVLLIALIAVHILTTIYYGIGWFP
jgi:hypothetical protein